MNKIKLKKCKACGEQFKPFNSLAKACGIQCALVLGREATAKKAKADAKKAKIEFRAADKSFQRNKAQKIFNEFIRLRDSNLGCVSCDKPKDWQGQWHASHWKSRGARPDLAFNEDNVHKSCSVCNKWLSGNVNEYRKSLVERIGQDRVEKLEKNINEVKRFADDYAKLSAIYQAKIKELKSLHTA